MTPLLTFDEHLVRLEAAAARLASLADELDPALPVPTCPGWAVADLVAHQAMVHRWATSHLRGEPDEGWDEQRALDEAGDDLLGFYRAGAAALLDTLRTVDPDVETMVFLADAPRPREFWARRQCHETTVHSVDAMAASLGRTPTAAEAGVDPFTAVDGIDELLIGFAPRRPTGLYDGDEVTVVVAPTDVDRAWTLTVRERITTTRGTADRADATFSGWAAALYLGLWNRGDEIVATGRHDLLTLWREAHRVTWS